MFLREHWDYCFDRQLKKGYGYAYQSEKHCDLRYHRRGRLLGLEKVLLEESMVNFLNNYSNGWGHLIMSAFFALIGVALILAPQTDATTKSIGISLLMTVSAAWFIPGAAKQISYNITRQIQASPPASTPPANEPPAA